MFYTRGQIVDEVFVARLIHSSLGLLRGDNNDVRPCAKLCWQMLCWVAQRLHLQSHSLYTGEWDGLML